MKEERSDIIFPIWRKKVDNNLLKNASTLIPIFFVSTWEISKIFENVNSKKGSEPKIKIIFRN